MVIPNALKGIPDIEQLYDAIDAQIEKVYEEVERQDEDNYFDNMSEGRVVRWEKMIHLTPKSTATIGERRFEIHSRVVDKLPYSYRVILSDLLALAPEAELVVDYENQAVTVKIALSDVSMVDAVSELLERKLPLNMIFEVIILYNTWSETESYTWGDLASKTWWEIKTDENL